MTALEDPAIREVALGGPDSATRSRIVWQLKMWPLPGLALPVTVEEPISRLTFPDCLSVTNSARWKDFVKHPGAWMSARTEPMAPPNGPCVLPPKAGYRRLENQLYRVEVHQGGAVGAATFKWSRENASVMTSWLGQNGNDLMVGSLGRDEALGFAAGQWVELIDLDHELEGQPGIMARLTDARMSAQGAVLTIDPASAASPVDFTAFGRNPRVVRWDNEGSQVKTPGGDIALTENQWLALEGGVEVFFQSGGTYRTGDYWLVAARTATGDVEWPVDDAVPPNPLPQLAHGVAHHYWHLAVVGFTAQDGKWSVLEDCRMKFAPAAAEAIHVTATNWANDDVFPSDRLRAEGLVITLDAPVDAASVSAGSATIAVEQAGRAAFLLEGPLGVSGNRISLKPDIPEQYLSSQLPTRVRVILRGNVIWGDFGGRLVYLDGEAFGQPDLRADKKTPRTALAFPSGVGARASQFESWFSLIAPPTPTIAGLTLNPSTIVSGARTTGTVTLSAAAGVNGAVVALATSNNDSVELPANVTVPAGATSAIFVANGLPAPGTSTITATLGNSSASAALTVIAISGLSLAPPSLLAGAASVGTITLSAPAPTGGAVIALRSNQAAIPVAASVTVPAGSSSGTFRVATPVGIATVQVTITAALGPSQRSAVLSVTGLPR